MSTGSRKRKATHKEDESERMAKASKSTPSATSEGQRIVVFLRAINVGGSANRVNMKELVKQCEAAGFRKVETYLQSGNVVLSTSLPPEEAARRVSEQVAKQGAESTCMARTANDLFDLVEHVPYDTENPTKVHACFLTAELSSAAAEALALVKHGQDSYKVHGATLYLSLPNGSGRATLTGAAIEKALRPFSVQTTLRNWRTVEKLAEMVRV